MKKAIYGIFCIIVVMLSVTAVSSAALETHDFGKFSMNVPAGADFTQNNATNGDLTITKDTDFSDPAISHPIWSGANLTIEYYDCGEDGFSGYKEVMSEYENDTAVEQSNGMYVYNSKVQESKYVVFKVKEGGILGSDVVVSISGDDLNQLKEMASTVEFK